MSERQRELPVMRLLRSISALGANVVAEAAVYPLRKWWSCRRFAGKPQTEAAWASPGAVRSWKTHGKI